MVACRFSLTISVLIETDWIQLDKQMKDNSLQKWTGGGKLLQIDQNDQIIRSHSVIY